MLKNPLLGKGLALLVVLLGLLWGLAMVRDLVTERTDRLREAQQGVADSLASSQTLVGPVLARECTETWRVPQGEGKDLTWQTKRRSSTLMAAPRQLSIEASTAAEPRYRGVFKVNAYALTASVRAEWPALDLSIPKAQHENGEVRCEGLRLVMGLNDTRGVRQAEIALQDQALEVAPGTGLARHRGLHAAVPAALVETSPGSSLSPPLRAHVQLNLVGTESLAVAPIADANDVRLAANWPHPSFGGRFLPASREITGQGFQAAWQVSALASTAKEALLAGLGVCTGHEGRRGDDPDGCIETFAVSFVDPVNPYVLSDRATKYGLLFIALTFVAVSLLEVMRRLRVHPIQYLLVGSALVVFFLLLVSLSEHWPFAWAYATAAFACTALLSYYAVHVLRGVAPGLGFGAAIAALFGALYVLLRLEQGALVLGSVLLFAVLGGVMVVTRKIDWYSLLAQWRAEPPAAEPAQA